MTDQPEALRVAEDLEQSRSASYTRDRNAARLLRKQHTEIERLRNALHRIKDECGRIARAALERKP